MQADKANKANEDWAKAARVIYCNCCFEMGLRFRKLGRKYAEQGDSKKAAELKLEAAIQLDAWRKARREMKNAV